MSIYFSNFARNKKQRQHSVSVHCWFFVFHFGSETKNTRFFLYGILFEISNGLLVAKRENTNLNADSGSSFDVFDGKLRKVRSCQLSIIYFFNTIPACCWQCNIRAMTHDYALFWMKIKTLYRLGTERCTKFDILIFTIFATTDSPLCQLIGRLIIRKKKKNCHLNLWCNIIYS